jgi:3-deoxy-manno-octulosonate cytidylyltransferase (CMP-KDO synthetase)
MSIACVIPARLNSSRFPRKLLSLAHGKTVLQRTFEQAKQCALIDHLFVATDSDEIADHVKGFGGGVIWTSETCQNGTERICEALEKEPILQNSSMVINVQGDHPCTQKETLEALIKSLNSDTQAVLSTAVTPILAREEYESPHVVKCVFDTEHNALYFSRSPIPYIREGLPLAAYAHIGVYCYRTPFLKEKFSKSLTNLQKSEDLEQLKVLENGNRIKIAVVKEKVLGVDTPQDLEKLKEILWPSNIFLSQVE